MEIISIEESPLRHGNTLKRLPVSNQFRGPFRAIRLCLLSILLPALLIAGPLYLRYHVYANQLYPLAMSDMRLIDNRVSTTWCQRQLVRANTTFNAFLLPEAPHTVHHMKPLTMVRELRLEDDMKEYWGFYLLKGSSVTVSTCTRWPGASLTIIRGHKHLHECAYIGDDSSEELNELIQAIEEGNYIVPNDTKDDAPSNNPGLMKRHRSDVKFHHPAHQNHTNHTIDHYDQFDDHDIHMDAKRMKELLNHLYEKTKTKNGIQMPIDHIHKHRNQSVHANEQHNLKFGDEASHRAPIKEKSASEEVFQDILKKLNGLGERGKGVLQKLNDKLGKNQTDEDDDEKRKQLKRIVEDAIDAMKIENDTDDLDGEPMKDQPVTNVVGKQDELLRKKRELVLSFTRNLNAHNEESNEGKEEGLISDGIADHRATVNETTLNDRSNSEFWSSFSSSEETLLNCAGLILNLPLTPHRSCEAHRTNKEALGDASLPNTVTYKVPTNGYYFFVFNSENEVQVNYLRIQFDLHKTVYNVSNSVAQCENSTSMCALNLDFFSNEKLVLELPVRNNDSLWNQEFVVVSECEPRTAIYMICVIAVPLIIILFAFH